jgi:hypothetical protein
MVAICYRGHSKGTRGENPYISAAGTVKPAHLSTGDCRATFIALQTSRDSSSSHFKSLQHLQYAEMTLLLLIFKMS